MVAIDLDGTLLSPTGEVTARVKESVHRALAAGLLVCFATGRNWTESRAIINAVGHYASAVFVGGAMVVDTAKDVTLHRTMMHPQLAREVCEALESAGHAALALQDVATAGVDYLVTGGVELNAPTRGWMKVTASTIQEAGRLAEHPHEHTIRVGIVAGREPAQVAKRALTERLGGRIVCQTLFVPAYDVEVLEVFDPAVNKWEGVQFVARRHGIEPAEIIAIGDDVNDLPMIVGAGLGVAMGNGRPEVLAAADVVIGGNQNEGLAEFLDMLVASGAVKPMPRDKRNPA